MSTIIKINFQERIRGNESKPENVELQWLLDVLKEKQGLFTRLFRKHIHTRKKLEVKVAATSVPEELIFNNNGPLFEVVYKGDRYPQPSNPVMVEMSDMSDQFQLLFNPERISDCRRELDKEPRVYTTQYRITLRDGSKDKTYDRELQVEIEPFKLDPTIAPENMSDEFEYEYGMGTQKLLDLVIKQPERWVFGCTPRQRMTISLQLKKNGSSVDLSDRVHIDAEDGGNEIEFDLEATKSVPVYIDFSKFTNPVDDVENYIIVPTVKVYALYQPDVVIPLRFDTLSFDLKKDPQGTELQVYVQRQDEEYQLLANSRQTVAMRYEFEPKSPLGLPVTIILTNLATDQSNRKAGIRVKNLTVQHQIADKSVNVEVMQGNKSTLVDPKVLFELRGSDVDAMRSSEVFIPNGVGSKSEVVLKFNPSKLVRVHNDTNVIYDFSIISVVSFDYWEDKDGTGITSAADKKTANIQVEWQLHVLPNPEWLCIDYGSSAIVCQYDNAVIDLHRRKKTLFEKKWVEYAERIEESLEQGTRFLSSDIVLTQQSEQQGSVSSLFSERPSKGDIELTNLAVCLSPTEQLIVDRVSHQLPCLKILVGNELLPSTGIFKTYQYRRLTNGKVELTTMDKAEQNGEANSLMRIFNIFSEAYGELMHFYVKEETDGKTINKLVLTYPTTYTPRHLQLLKSIVKLNFPDLHDDYLKFVCESDAVAAYYIHNWAKFNPGLNIADQNETVLVFDMGAGTLDLTLFKKNVCPKDIQVEILGKIGTGKAGNYLDYIIAEILKEKYPQLLKDLAEETDEDQDSTSSKIVSLAYASANQVLEARLALKSIIKSQIKPKLFKNKTIDIKYELKTGEEVSAKIYSNEILNDKRFLDYLNDVCSKLIQRLQQNVGTNVAIDRVLMSGRGCRLRAIRTKLKETLVVTPTSFTEVMNEDADKTAVVEGAIAYASSFSSADSDVKILSRRLYANYGIAYQQYGKWQYVELINCSAFAPEFNTVRLNNYLGDAHRISSLQSAQKLYVMQSYMDEKMTVDALNSNDMEFVSVMEVINVSNLPKLKELNMRLSIDYNNSICLQVNGLQTQGSAPKGVDLGSEITKRSIWPVTI